MRLCVLVNNHNSLALCRLAESVKPDYVLLIVSKNMLPRIQPLKALHDIYVVDNIQIVKFQTLVTKENRTHVRSNTKLLSWANERKNILFITLKATRIFFKLQKIYWQIRCLLKKKKITTVLCYSDRNLDYPESALLKVSKKLGISVTLPYLAQYDPDIARKDRLIHTPWLQTTKLSGTSRICFSKIIRMGEYKGVLFQSLEVLVAHYFFGTLSKNVWWTGCGLADLVCVDNKRTAITYEKNGCPTHKIKIVGHSDYAVISQSKNKRKKLRNCLLPRTKTLRNNKIITLSMPQFYEQGYLSWEEHLSVIENIFDTIPYEKAQLLVSLHPRQSAFDYKEFLKKYNHDLLDEPLSSIIGATDILLASNSSVLIWGGYCGVWTIGTWCPHAYLYSDLDFIEYIPKFDHLNARLNQICDMEEDVMPVLSKDDRYKLSLDELTDTALIDVLRK